MKRFTDLMSTGLATHISQQCIKALASICFDKMDGKHVIPSLAKNI